MLSLEAPVVAIIWQTLMAHTHRVALIPGTTTGLALCVWLIYLIDRLLDGMSAGGMNGDIRHAFYRRHWRLIGLVVIPVVTAVLVWIALFLIPEGLLWQCSALVLLIAIYLACFPARHHRRFVGALGGLIGLGVIVGIFMLPLDAGPKIQFAIIGLLMMTFGFFHRLDKAASSRIPKEPLGSLLFSLGCSAGVQFFSTGDGVAAMSMDVLLLWMVFSMNMFGISRHENESGAVDGHSVAVLWPKLSRFYPLVLLGCLVACAAIALVPAAFPARTGELALGCALSLLLLGIVWLCRSRLGPLSYRVLADLALTAPVVVLLLQHGVVK